MSYLIKCMNESSETRVPDDDGDADDNNYIM